MLTSRKLANGRIVQVDESGRVRVGLDEVPDFSGPDEECGYCRGSGLFYMGGGVVNGKYTGRTGPCFRCEGKGIETAADRKRNYWYDRKYRRV